ncbi:MAG: LamG-like jellyroll fold domain-containing protein [Candidatus Falkowbacteria bacterium]
MKKILIIIFGLIFLPKICGAMPPGTLVYRTSENGRMFGYSGDPLIYSEKGIVKNINSGHVGIYIGQENGVDYIVEALANGIVKTPADKFVNLGEGEKYLGAKIPKNLSAIQQAKVVAIAKSLVGKNLAYDFDFKTQKGPESGEWTCVGLTEKLYESANIYNPNNLGSLEYETSYYAIDITPDGFDNYSTVNSYGDCFSADYEYSKIAARVDILIPAPELVGFDVGLIKDDERYIFIPYTQYLQPSLSDITTDITMESYFNGSEVRGSTSKYALALRWSLINNPSSSLSTIARKTKEAVISLKNRIFGNGTDAAEIALVTENTSNQNVTSEDTTAKTGALINKATSTKLEDAEINDPKTTNTGKQATTAKTSTSKTVSTKTNSTQTNSVSNNKTNQNTNTINDSVEAASYYSPAKASENTVIAADSKVIETPKIATVSRIYATGNNKWIELYNPTDLDFDLAAAGYRLEKAKTAADPTLIMRIGKTEDGSYPGGTIIKARGTYMIVKSTASDYYLRQADAVATRDDFTWPSSGYTIYLGTGAISSNTDPDIVEALGYGANATYYQGDAPAPEITDNYSLNRQKGSGNNNLDFKLVKSDDPTIDWTIDNEEETSNTATSTIINTAASTSTISTTTHIIATTTPSISNSTNNIASTTSNIATSSPNQANTLPLLINGIYGSGVNDWIELYNPNNFAIDLYSNEYRLEKTKTAIDPALIMRIGDPLDGYYPGTTIINANGKYLIVRDDADQFFKDKASAIATRLDFSWLNSGYTLYLASGPVSSSTDEDIIDTLGFGLNATFWRGYNPAEAMKDGYSLSRTSNTGNNNLDYNLLKSDDPSIDWSEENSDTGTSMNIYNFSTSSYDLFSFPEPINSAGLEYVWHFDECTGSTTASSLGNSTLNVANHWKSGKYICSKEAGYDYGKIVGPLDKQIDINNFTISFWFKATQSYPRLSLTLANDQSDSINVTLEQGLMQFSGLANPSWRYYQDFAFDNTWRQATLVVNRNDGYWALYIDGEEVFYIDTYKMMPAMDLIELGGDNGPFAVDELAIWSRALTPDEIIDIRNSEAPFSPVYLPEAQQIPKLKHFWNFNEGIGTTTRDLIGNTDLPIDKNAWTNIDVNNSALNNNSGRIINVNFPEIDSSDLSLTFWWRSSNTYYRNESRVALRNETSANILSLIPSQFVSGYVYSNAYSYFSSGENQTIPNDLNWHLLALSYDSYRNLLRFYVDGVEKGSRSYIWGAEIPLINALEIVSEQGQTEIDNLGIWEGALSPAQIQEIFANN